MNRSDVVQTIRQVAAAEGFPDVDLLLATAFQESGFDPKRPGDYVRGVPQSFGVFQMNSGGRGAGVPIAQREDVSFATRAAIREFRQVRAKHPDVSPGAWAALAQRPANQGEYAANINRMLAGQDKGFASAVGSAPTSSPNAPIGTSSFTTGPVSVSTADAPDWLQQSWAAGGSFGKALGGAAQTVRQGVQGLTDAAGAVWPVAGQRPGQVNNPFGGAQSRAAGATVPLPSSNVGADLTARYGADVVAPVSGTVLQVYDAPNETDRNLNSGWGGMTLLRGDDGYTYRLSHAKPGSLGVRPGQRVTAGQYLQQIGVSGNSTGPHLDAEVRDPAGNFVDIVQRLRQQGAATVSGGQRLTLSETPAVQERSRPWTVDAQEAPDWLRHAWDAGSTVGRSATEAVTQTASTVAQPVADVAAGAAGAWKVATDAAPDWLKQAWDAGSTVGR